MEKRYKHITLSDRTLIQMQLQQGFSPAAIAESLGRHRSSITRELARNGWKPTPSVRPVGRPSLAGGYSSSQAQRRCERLAKVARVKRKLIMGNALWLRVKDGLKQGLSPEQITGTMFRMNEPIRYVMKPFIRLFMSCLRESGAQK